jgi:hypothetical protein
MTSVAKKKAAFFAESETVSPPNKSSNEEYQRVHDEAFGLQALARVELSNVLIAKDRTGIDFIEWGLFVTEPTPYKLIKDGNSALKFLKSKLREKPKKQEK